MKYRKNLKRSCKMTEDPLALLCREGKQRLNGEKEIRLRKAP
jgi:hypothetical protein